MGLLGSFGAGGAAGGTGMALGLSNPVSAGLMAGGALIKGLAGMSAAKKKNAALTSGIQEQDYYGRAGSRQVNDTISQLEASRPDIAGSRSQFVSSLRGMPQVRGIPTASRAFASDAAGANAGAGAYGRQLSDVFARLRAPQTQAVQDSAKVGRLGTKLGLLSRRAGSADYLNKLKVDSIQANPWLSMAGDAMSSLGKYGASGGGGFGGGLDDFTISGAAANGGYKYGR